MHKVLRLHLDSRCAAVTRIEVDVSRPRPGSLLLHYFVMGRISGLRLPPVATPTRGDGLWRHTCFEAFLRPLSGAAYYEFNLAPSRHWAAYRFSDYRHAMRAAREIPAPRVETGSDGGCYDLRASLDLDRVPGLPGDAAWRLGLAAVIEETSGRRSYWALAHPPGKADFHHSDCFALELPAASRS